LSLPGSEKYNPALPRVAKIRADGNQACDEVTFMDDNHTLGPTLILTKSATRQVALGVQRLGAQEAARKRRVVGQRNGAWAGKIVFTYQNLDRKFVSQKKWDKAKDGLLLLVEVKAQVIPYKKLML
jgi:hypothetical protein